MFGESNGSYEANQPGIAAVLSSIPQVMEQVDRGRTREGSDGGIVEATDDCTLSKTLSDRSAKSAKSVKSLYHVGSYALGTLRIHSPSPVRKAPVFAYECMKSGDVIVVRDIPGGTMFGYDACSFMIRGSGQFEGVKNIPSGAHFIWADAGRVSMRNGFWIISRKRALDDVGEIIVKRWDKHDEVLEEYVHYLFTFLP